MINIATGNEPKCWSSALLMFLEFLELSWLVNTLRSNTSGGIKYSFLDLIPLFNELIYVASRVQPCFVMLLLLHFL